MVVPVKMELFHIVMISPKGSRGWEEGKIIKTFGTKVLEIELVKNFSLGFL